MFTGAGIGYGGANLLRAQEETGVFNLVYSEGEKPGMIYIYRDGELVGDIFETQEDTFIPIVYGPGDTIPEKQKSGIVGAPFYTKDQAKQFVQRFLA